MISTHTTIDSSIGRLTLVARGPSLRGVYFPGHRYPPTADALGMRSASGFAAATEQLVAFLEGERTTFDLRTAATGDAFQERVWKLIAEIPYGETTTYGELARELGDVALARAVGGAVGRNPLSIIVPCHRVVGRDGALTGYAGGLERKRFLLELETASGRRASVSPQLF